MLGESLSSVIVGLALLGSVASGVGAQTSACFVDKGEVSALVLADETIQAAQACYYEGALDLGVALIDQALRGLPPDGYRWRRMSLLTRRGQLVATRAFVTNQGAGEAVDNLETAVHLASELGPGPELADALTQLGFALYTTKFLEGNQDLSAAGKAFDRAHEIRREVGEPRGLAESTFYQGILRERRGEQDEALAFYQEALRIANECGCALEASYAHRHIGFVLQRRGDLDSALEHFEASLELRERIGFKVYLPLSLLAVADVHRQLGQIDEALPLARRARRLSSALGELRVLVLGHLALGEILSETPDLGAAGQAFEEARSLAEQIGYAVGVEAARDELERLHPGAIRRGASVPSLAHTAASDHGSRRPLPGVGSSPGRYPMCAANSCRSDLRRSPGTGRDSP